MVANTLHPATTALVAVLPSIKRRIVSACDYAAPSYLV
jgi:hypothetical protein